MDVDITEIVGGQSARTTRNAWMAQCTRAARGTGVECTDGTMHAACVSSCFIFNARFSEYFSAYLLSGAPHGHIVIQHSETMAASAIISSIISGFSTFRESFNCV